MSVIRSIADRVDFPRKSGVVKTVVGLIVLVAGILTTYHATIYGIKADLAAKADAEVVERIDARLIRIETLLTETVASRAELLEMRDQLHRQLTAIETKLDM
jgi:hypothetical protein